MTARHLGGLVHRTYYSVLIHRPDENVGAPAGPEHTCQQRRRFRPWAVCTRPYADFQWLSEEIDARAPRSAFRSFQSNGCLCVVFRSMVPSSNVISTSDDDSSKAPKLAQVSRLSLNWRSRRAEAVHTFVDEFFKWTSPFCSNRFELFFFTQLPTEVICGEVAKPDFSSVDDHIARVELRRTERKMLMHYVGQKCENIFSRSLPAFLFDCPLRVLLDQ